MATSAQIKNYSRLHGVSREAARAALSADIEDNQVYIIALRHHGSSHTPEFFSAKVCLPRKKEVVNSKTALLRHICVGAWLHIPPVDAVAEYLVQTDSYKAFRDFDSDGNFFFLEFYECDPERPSCYSCRNILATTCEDDAMFSELAEGLLEQIELASGGSYSVERWN